MGVRMAITAGLFAILLVGYTIGLTHGWQLFGHDDEIERLKNGKFTEAEFQNLCHEFSADDACRFRAGCDEYFEKLFGRKPQCIHDAAREYADSVLERMSTCDPPR